MRTTREVFEDHLRRREADALDGDLEHNYADDSVLLTGYGIFQGKEAIRASATVLYQQLDHARYIYRTRLVHEQVAFLEWSAEGDLVRVGDGADSYQIADGHIRVQTIHYTVLSV